MNLNKHISFFDPLTIKDEIHIIGVGAIGSNIATQLVRLGVTNLHIWDFDTVDEHNITNQIYTSEDIGKPKTEALLAYLLKINPNCNITTHKRYASQTLKGFIFMCVDSIETRHRIAEEQQYNMFIKLVIDTRIGLERGQVLITPWREAKKVNNYIEMCNFKDSETEAPVSACGTTLSVSPTVLLTTAYAVSELINFIKTGKTQNQIHFDAFSYKTRAI